MPVAFEAFRTDIYDEGGMCVNSRKEVHFENGKRMDCCKGNGNLFFTRGFAGNEDPASLYLVSSCRKQQEKSQFKFGADWAPSESHSEVCEISGRSGRAEPCARHGLPPLFGAAA